MGLHFCVSDHERDVCEVFVFENSEEILGQLRLRHLHANRQHPNVVEAELAVVAPEDVELPLDNVGSVPTARAGFEFSSDYLFPVVALNVENVHVVHPVHSIVASEVNNF